MTCPIVTILNEHDTWQDGLFEELRRRGIRTREIRVDSCCFDLGKNYFDDSDLVINRASPSAMSRGDNRGAAIFYTLQLIEHFERLKIPVVNGSKAYLIEISKARQCQLLKENDLPFPPTVIINNTEKVEEAAQRIGKCPLILKPNIGGSGFGAERFKVGEKLTHERVFKVLESSPDKTAVLQEDLELDKNPAYEDPKFEFKVNPTYRVEMLGEEHLYSLAVSGDLNKCPTENCTPGDCTSQDTKFAEFEPSIEIKDEVALIARKGELDICGVEFLISNGKRYYFDINALSNFRPKGKTGLPEGMDPTAKFVDYLQKRWPVIDTRRKEKR